MSAPRGPSGHAAPPPSWLDDVDLPIEVVPAGASLHRVHRSAQGPIFFGPGRGVEPTYRFDSARGAFGVLYVGLDIEAALVETLSRNPARRMVDYSEIDSRSSSLLFARRDLKMSRLHGSGLQQVGCDNSISTGPYEPCGVWSDALWAHKSVPDGIAYQSRHDSHRICLAIFERPNLEFTVAATTPLRDRLGMIASLLNGYGKSVTGPAP